MSKIKEKRAEIYEFIKESYGELNKETYNKLGKLLKQLCEVHTEQVLNNESRPKIKKLEEEIAKLNKERTRTMQAQKPLKVNFSKTVSQISKKQRQEPEPFFNSDFIR